MANIIFNVSNTTAISLFPAEYFTFYADAVIPANSSLFAVVDVALPVDGLSAVMTFVSMSIVSITALSSSVVNFYLRRNVLRSVVFVCCLVGSFVRSLIGLFVR